MGEWSAETFCWLGGVAILVVLAGVNAAAAYRNGCTDGYGFSREPSCPGYWRAGRILKRMAHRWPELADRGDLTIAEAYPAAGADGNPIAGTSLTTLSFLKRSGVTDVELVLAGDVRPKSWLLMRLDGVVQHCYVERVRLLGDGRKVHTSVLTVLAGQPMSKPTFLVAVVLPAGDFVLRLPEGDPT